MQVERMKRYWVFAYENYYPGGGTNDLVGTFETKDQALACLLRRDSAMKELVYIQDDGTPKHVSWYTDTTDDGKYHRWEER